MTSRSSIKSLFCTYVWGNILAIIIIIVLLALGIKYGIDYYTHKGESIVVPNIIHKQLDEAKDIMDRVGLTIQVTDTGYVKTLPPNCILEQSPRGGKRIKSTRVIYVSINASTPPTLEIPDLIDNNSLIEAQALLMSMGFKVGEPEYVPGEKAWIYGIIVNGHHVQMGDRIPCDAKVILQVGDGTRNITDSTSLAPVVEYEEVEVNKPEYEYEYEWVEVPVDENGNEIKPNKHPTHPKPIVPSAPPDKATEPSEKNNPKNAN